MPILLGAVADDYTGASDLANTFSKNGLRTVQTIGAPPDTLPLPDVDAVVVALKIRSVAADEAVNAARKAREWLTARGAKHVMYKICSTFDSTDEGNIGPVTEAFRADAQAGTVIVTPAFPETGRSVYLAHLFVNGELLSESPLKDHPLNPMHDANLARVLARQSKAPVGLVDLATVSRGADAVAAALAASWRVSSSWATRSLFHSSSSSWPCLTLSPSCTGSCAIWPPALGDSLARRHAVTVPARVLATVFSTVPRATAAIATAIGLVRALHHHKAMLAAIRTRVQMTTRRVLLIGVSCAACT